MNQTKVARMHPGAFRSCLIPFTDQILDWWYDDLLTAAEIQRRLKAEGLDVARTTVMRFIKVREQRAAKRKRPPALRKKNTISAEHPVISPTPQTQSLCLGTAAFPASETAKSIPPVQQTKQQAGNRLFQILKNTSAQELGRMADEAQEKQRHINAWKDHKERAR